MTGQNAGILGMGHAYPEGILTNADLEKMVDTNDEWITSRTGIKQRHKAAADEYTSQFGTKAAIQAMERAGIGPEDLDIIICATTTPDQIMAAKRKEIRDVMAEIEPFASASTIEKVYMPLKTKQTQMLGNGDAKAGAAELVEKLRTEVRVI